MILLLSALALGGLGPKTFLDKDDTAGDGKPKPKPKPGTGDDDQEDAPVPKEEVRKLRQTIRDLKAQVSEYESKAPDVAKIAAERDAANIRASNAEKDLALLDLGVKDADDRAYVRERYNMSTNGVKDPPEFGEWLEGQREKRWFKNTLPELPETGADKKTEPASEFAAKKQEGGAKKEDAGADKKPEKKPAFDPNAGTRPNAGGGGPTRPAYTREELAGMDVDTYRAERESVIAASKAGRIE